MTKRKQKLLAAFNAKDAEAKALLALAEAREDGRMTAEEQPKFDALVAELENIDKDIKAEDRLEAAVKGAPVSAAVVVTQAAEDRPFTSLGEQLVAIARAQSPRGAFPGAGEFDQRLMGAASGANTSVGSEGGFLVQKDHAVELLNKGEKSGTLASLCSKTEISANADSLEVVTIDETSRATGSRWGGVRVYRAAEADTVTASKPKLGKWERRLEDMMGIAYATERQLADGPALGAVFTEAFTDEFGFKLDDEIYRGTGAGECQGVLNANCLVSVAKETGQAADTILAENVIKMYARVPAKSRFRGVWVYNVAAEVQLQQMQIGTGTSAQLVYMPPGGLSGSQYGTIYGRPAMPIEHASALGDVGDIAFLDLTEYKLITKGGIQQDDSIHVRFLYNERTFRWVTRVNGAPKWSAALTPYKGSATLSPFVTLDAR